MTAPCSLSHCLAATDDGRVVAFDGSEALTLGQFRERVRALCAVLRARPEARWLLIHDNTAEFAIGLFALLHAGKQAVLPPNAQPGTLADLQSSADALLGDGSGPLPHLAIDGHPHSTAALPPFDSRACSLTIFTSGSTGEPKRIDKPLPTLEAELAVLEQCWGRTLGDARVLATVSHQHIYGLLFRLLWPMTCGRAFCANTFQFPEPWYAAITAQQRCVLVSSPSQLKRFPEALDLAAVAPRVAAVFSSGGPLPPEASFDWAARLGQAPIEVLGSTETGGVAWRQQMPSTETTPWQTLPSVIVSLADGCLAVQSPFTGLTEPFVMGDRAELLGDGLFRLHGRTDTIVKIEEKRVSLTAMEQALLACPGVADARVVTLPDNPNRLGAVVVANADGQAMFAALGRRAAGEHLREQLLAHFERVLLPRKWRFVDALPMNAQGKVTTHALQALFVDTPLLLHETATERTLRWQPPASAFAGHFPGLPILPGVVQFDAAVRACSAWHDIGDFRGIRKLKFSEPVVPGDTLTLVLQRDDTQRVSFRYECAGRTMSAGIIEFGG